MYVYLLFRMRRVVFPLTIAETNQTVITLCESQSTIFRVLKILFENAHETFFVCRITLSWRVRHIITRVTLEEFFSVILNYRFTSCNTYFSGSMLTQSEFTVPIFKKEKRKKSKKCSRPFRVEHIISLNAKQCSIGFVLASMLAPMSRQCSMYKKTKQRIV